MSRRPPEAPGLVVLLSGGVAVLAVLAFVGALALGSSSSTPPGSLVRVVQADGPGRIAVLAGRCLDQRVTSAAVSAPGGQVLWRVVAEDGTIERRFVVGGTDLAPGVEVDVPLTGPLPDALRAEVTLREGEDETSDAVEVALADVPPEGDLLEEGAPACGGDEGPGGLTWLFGLGAAFVVGGYLAMVLRYVRR